jgi:hypothetical protein
VLESRRPRFNSVSGETTVVKPRFRLLAAVAVGPCLLAALLWSPNPRTRSSAADLAAAPTGAGLGGPAYSAAFDRELNRIGQITPKQFADRYPPPEYLPGLTWDPTTAKFFDRIHVDTVVKPGPNNKGEVRLPGYKLTADELAAFKQNGFVVSERLGGFSFGQAYYDVYSRDLPVFITSDSILHAWHRSFDAVLEELETGYLSATLDLLLAAMHGALPAAKAEYGAGPLADSVRDADYFLTVARRLLTNWGHPTKFDQDKRVDETLTAIWRQQIQEFVLFGRERNMDFSQFKPRGRYEKTGELTRYFKAMMWCGRTDLRVAGGFDATGELSSPRELGSAVVLLDLVRRAGRMEEWRQFDRVLQTFVGRTDSATFDDLARVMTTAGLKSPADLKAPADLTRLAGFVEASDAGKQDIRGDVYITPDGPAKVVLPRSFTLLGQKFAVDSWATAKVVFDDVYWNGKKVIRRVPSALDVAFAALGNDHVIPTLTDRMERGPHRFRDRKPYQHNLAAVRATVDGLAPEDWDGTIYTSWLKALRTLSRPADATRPEATRTRAWAMKQTNTQLASWGQLRHDTILYVKQSYTSGAMCYYPAGYVEPVAPFWRQMQATATRAADLLARTPFPPAVQPTRTKQVAFFRQFAAQMDRLKRVADRQQARADLTAEERKVLEDVMQIRHQPVGSGGDVIYHCSGWYPALFYRGPTDCLQWDALVADVHTNVPTPIHEDPGCVLHQGVGNVDLMVIAIENGPDRVAYVGPTLSHYEFEMPGTARKTDAEWKAELANGKVPPRPEWTRGYLVPATERKPIDPRTRRQLGLRE